MVEIRTLVNVDFEQIHTVFADAFSDYVVPFELTIQDMQYMFERRGYDLELSFGAFKKEHLVGITINGIGQWNGKLTAYDSGTGVIKEFRKRGIASRMFNESIPTLRENDICQYLLEVIKTNTSAFKLYKKAGFKVLRELNYYITGKNELRYDKLVTHPDFRFRTIEKPDWETFRSFWNFEPSWQNSIDSLNRKIDHFVILGIYKNSELAGYGIIEKHTGDIPQLAISPRYRRKGLAMSLFRVLINYSDVDSIKIINSDSAYLLWGKFMERMDIKASGEQYEMLMEL